MQKQQYLLLLLLVYAACKTPQSNFGPLRVDVLVIGGGTGGVAAGLQSARSGAQTLICEPASWLGGMLSTAGVSATDGNHRLPSGLWNEFREALYAHYGSPEALNTGWVSNTQFEPHVADSILKAMAALEKNLNIFYRTVFQKVIKEGKTVKGAVFKNQQGRVFEVRAAVTIDATELGDVFANAGAAYNLGVDARADCGERYCPEKAMPLIQDLTWAAVLKDYGPHADKTLPQSATYDPNKFNCCCADRCVRAEKVHDCTTMLNYARLPRGKIMINWPIHGNDIYLDVVEASPEAREQAYRRAKEHTLNFIRYLQVELGYKNLGLADDEFPTADQLPDIPYNRESRRLRGVVRLNVNHLIAPFEQAEPLYRTGCAVGDYPLDHHHNELPEPIPETFPDIPSFNIPLGALVPIEVDGLLAADKGASVTHLVNGASRLQPCVLLTGQAAGALAAGAIHAGVAPRAVSVRKVQKTLLAAGAFLMPYLDVIPRDPAWAAVQRVGATGILRGKGIPKEWANETWFYPDSTLLNTTFLEGLQSWQPGFYNNVRLQAQTLCIEEAASMLESLISNEKFYYANIFSSIKSQNITLNNWLKNAWTPTLGLKQYDSARPITRRELAVVLDAVLNPFEREVGWSGAFK